MLGPEDEQYIHDDDDDNFESSILLVPPSVPQKPYLLLISVFEARHIMRMDRHGSGSDPFLYAEFAGVRLKSKKRVYDAKNQTHS